MPNGTLPPRELYVPPASGRVLLHSCCAPCSCEIIEGLVASGMETTVFYYNPNIDTREEYEHRKAENKRFADKLGVPFVDADYDNDAWLERVKGLEAEPERGKRCTVCFAMRLQRAALYAHENGFPLLATSLGISRLKNQAQVYACGRAAVLPYDDVLFWDYNWRAKGGADRGAAIAKREEFYRQTYCGCSFSRRDAVAPNKNAPPKEAR